MKQPITALQTHDCDWLLDRFIEVNFSKIKGQQPNFQEWLCLPSYHLCKIESQINEWIIISPYELSITTIYSMMALSTRAQTNCNHSLLDASHNCLSIYRTKDNYNFGKFLNGCNHDFSINGLNTENHLWSRWTPTPYKIKINNCKLQDLVIRIEWRGWYKGN